MSETRAVAGSILIASLAILGAAFAFQHLAGLQPCVLCIWQRYPYAATIALGALALLLADHRRLAAGILALSGGVFLIGAGIAAYHVGVEQGWWQGTAACGSTRPPSGSIEELRERLMRTPVVRCDEVAWSLLGVSMAGYNLLLSLGLASTTLWATYRQARR